MTLTSPQELETARRIQLLLEQRRSQLIDTTYLRELRDRVRYYEQQFGISSERIHDAIDEGTLIEDQEVGHWIFAYSLLRSVEEA
jgi:hypothetical protein